MDKNFLKDKIASLVSLCKKEIAEGGRIVVTGHDMPDHDSIISAVMLRELLSRLGVEATVKFGTRPDGVTMRGVTELGILDGVSFDGFDERDRLILVDHHACFYENEVIGCVDHHTTPPEPHFDFYLIVKASSCGRVIYDMAVSVGVSDDYLERLGVQSVYLDTQSCRSPKFEQSDLPWLSDGIARLGIDEKKLVKMGFCLCDPKEELEILADYGFKRYRFDGKVGASTCIQIDVDREDEWQEVISSIIEFLVKKMRKENIFLWAFVVNKPEIMRSDIYFIRPDRSVELVKLDRLASRSRDVIPVISDAQPSL